MCDIITFNMHVEIKVAQTFVLNFLYNKLPRRRVNLFGEELDAALRDKFADHWYPDKPFKGSAFRCLKVTDPADPVLNRAARESGNPVPDIVENLPTDLAIWIDPGEVSYRIGEKGSVKILYSESLDGSYLQNYAATEEAAAGASPEAAAVAAATAAAMAAAAAFHNNTRGPGGPPGVPAGPGAGPGNMAQNFLSLDNLNLAVGGLSLNSNNAVPPASQVSPVGPTTNGVVPPQGPPNGVVPPPQGPPNGAKSPNNGTTSGGSGGFAPFQPRSHQPITYTAGSFAQTKFGSTKLKSNAKKTNRMSPTEFSNYIKQRALQKQGSQMTGSTTAPLVNNGSGVAPTNGGGPILMPTANNFTRNNVGGNGANFNNSNNRPIVNNGFHSHHNSGGSGTGSNTSNIPVSTSSNLNYGGGSGRIPPHQGQPQDPFFYPLFPDRGQNTGCNNSNNSSNGGGNFYPQQPQPHQPHQQPPLFSNGSTGSTGSSSSASSSSSTSSTTNPWSFGDADAELFLQDILTVGLNSKTGQRSGNNPLFNDFTNGGSFNDYGGCGGSLGGGSLNSGSSSFGSNSSSTSLGLSTLNNLGGLGTFGGLGSGQNGGNGGSGVNMFSMLGCDAMDPVDQVANGQSEVVSGQKMASTASAASPGNNGVTGNTSSPSEPQKYQQRVLVAN